MAILRNGHVRCHLWPCQMSILRNGHVTMSILRNGHVTLSILAFGGPIYQFWDVITQQQTRSYVVIPSLGVPAVLLRPQQEKQDFLISKYRDYRKGVIERLRYVRSVCYKVLPAPNL